MSAQDDVGFIIPFPILFSSSSSSCCLLLCRQSQASDELSLAYIMLLYTFNSIVCLPAGPVIWGQTFRLPARPSVGPAWCFAGRLSARHPVFLYWSVSSFSLIYTCLSLPACSTFPFATANILYSLPGVFDYIGDVSRGRYRLSVFVRISLSSFISFTICCCTRSASSLSNMSSNSSMGSVFSILLRKSN